MKKNKNQRSPSADVKHPSLFYFPNMESVLYDSHEDCATTPHLSLMLTVLQFSHLMLLPFLFTKKKKKITIKISTFNLI
jgi:hypothetical protein